MATVFLLSPAHCGGKRAGYLFNPQAQFDLARRLHAGETAELGEIHTFLSGLYFRGKLAYARHFSRPPEQILGVQVITPNRGLVEASMSTTLSDLQDFAGTPISATDECYRAPLVRDAAELAKRLPADARVVLLGSIASDKYADILLECLGQRLMFPSEFVGRGDLSRGGLMLRCVEFGEELEYIRVTGAIRRGRRPPRLARRTSRCQI